MARKAKQQPILTLEYALDQLRLPRVQPKDLGITYGLLHDWDITSETKLERVTRRVNPTMSKGGVTQRTRKVWSKIYSIAHPMNTDRVEGSLWRVHFYATRDGVAKLGHPRKPAKMSSWSHPLEDLGDIGWVAAATETEAQQIAQATFGPIAMLSTECISVHRDGPHGHLAQSKTVNDAVKTLSAKIDEKRAHLELLKWEIDQMETLMAFQKMHGE